MRLRELALLVLLASCTSTTHDERPRAQAMVSLVSGFSLQAVSPPFVSVVDSVDVTVVTSAGAPLNKGARVSGHDTSSASFVFDVPVGMATFDAKVLSSRGALLYSGSSETKVDGQGFVVRVPVSPQSPVLLVQPDLATITVPQTGFGKAVITVYNRGVGSLVVLVADTSAISLTQCPRTRCFSLTPRSLQVPAGASATVAVDSVRRFQSTIPVTFSSPQGDVQVMFRTP